jgi:hypothetical protein
MHSDVISRILCDKLNIRAYAASTRDIAHKLATLHGIIADAQEKC